MKRIKVNTGHVFGNLTVLREGELLKIPSGQVNRTIICKCKCGNEKQVRLVHLVRGKTESCGCAVRTANGKSHTKFSKLFRSINYRCTESYVDSHLYFHKGIRVCNEWKDNFQAFEEWCIKNKYKKGLHIDRIDNSKGYSPENCRFVTCKVNANNRDITFYVNYKGEKKSLQLLLQELNYPNKYATVYTRLKRGWDVEKAINQEAGNNYLGRKIKTL